MPGERESHLHNYKNLHGDSGVIGYEICQHCIIVEFHDGSVYSYTEHSAGKDIIDEMKALAEQGRGLCTFISTVARDLYEEKLV